MSKYDITKIDKFEADKMYTFLRGFAIGCDFNETLHALSLARKLHLSQVRKNGEPYIVHPLTMACHAIALGLKNDVLIATILLHDVVEDCGVEYYDLPCNMEVKEAVKVLSYRKPEKYLEKDGCGPSLEDVKSAYYASIRKNPVACIAKIIDRCHNVSSMAGVFTKEKLDEYINETEHFVLPMLRYAKDTYPEYSDYIFILKYHIYSVLNAIKGTILTYS